MDRLIVKNFGPLKDIDIELNKVNLFIGENGSGKSVLAKLITILSNYTETSDSNLLIEQLKKFNINFLNDDTYIKKDDFIIKDKKRKLRKLKIDEKYLKTLQSTLEYLYQQEKENKRIYEKINKELLNLYNKNYKKTFEESLKKSNEIFQKLAENLQKQGIVINNLSFDYKYLPAERNLISLFNKSLSSFLVADIPIPKFLLEFMSDFEKATNEIKELEILNIKYINTDGLDRHKIYFNNQDYLPLEQSSSGIQSAIPMLLTAKYFAKKYRGIVIEEPEQNLFPKAQKEVIEFLLKEINEKNSLFLMTHSPYVLSTLNILMMAHKVGSLSSKASKEVEKIIPKSKWLNRDDFSAYYIEDGKAKNIKGKTGLISENVIDDISDEIDSEFQELLELYREFKNDK